MKKWLIIDSSVFFRTGDGLRTQRQEQAGFSKNYRPSSHRPSYEKGLHSLLAAVDKHVDKIVVMMGKTKDSQSRQGSAQAQSNQLKKTRHQGEKISNSAKRNMEDTNPRLHTNPDQLNSLIQFLKDSFGERLLLCDSEGEIGNAVLDEMQLQGALQKKTCPASNKRKKHSIKTRKRKEH